MKERTHLSLLELSALPQLKMFFNHFVDPFYFCSLLRKYSKFQDKTHLLKGGFPRILAKKLLLLQEGTFLPDMKTVNLDSGNQPCTQIYQVISLELKLNGITLHACR